MQLEDHVKSAPKPCICPSVDARAIIKRLSLRHDSVFSDKNTVAVHAVVGRVVHVSVTETVECRGTCMETQACYIEDCGGNIKLQLWDKLIGRVVVGQTYKWSNLSTRMFGGKLYVTTTRLSKIELMDPLPGLKKEIDFHIDEGEVKISEGKITSVEVVVSRRCCRCQAWQEEFEVKAKFHRCVRCKRLQILQMYESTVSASLTLSGKAEEELMVPNTVVKRYSEKENLFHLLDEAQDFEEHLMTETLFRISVQNHAVIKMEKVPERRMMEDMQPDAEQNQMEDVQEVSMEGVDVESQQG
ncbi:uncharacterized protein [Chanodichthys erythropterus]|uniref:uncharacterized protein isoform X2 n=1 Tax=Chanodichthys erythropterus TaxID=933992 RepID=UPI00351E44D2